jgi:hypothetical protein
MKILTNKLTMKYGDGSSLYHHIDTFKILCIQQNIPIIEKDAAVKAMKAAKTNDELLQIFEANVINENLPKDLKRHKYDTQIF